jgi:uncharacterized protein involved in exopolysaccharide biosynthesis
MQSTSNAADPTLAELMEPVFARWRLMLAGPIAIGALAVAGSFLFTPIFTATTTLLPPQQRTSGALAALSALGDLGSLAGVASGVKNPVDQYVSLLQSVTVTDRIIDKFDLLKVYDKEYRQDAREVMERTVTISAGKKDGIITIAVDDEDPKRAAEIANQYVEELRRLTSSLALSEAKQRRLFFQAQLEDARKQLDAAQKALTASGFQSGVINAEPKAAVERYAALSAQLTAYEVELRTLRSTFTDNSTEVQRTQAAIQGLRSQLAALERAQTAQGPDTDYVSRYREFKYRETLFDIVAKQYEMARVDEAQDSALIQVIDAGAPPEKKSRPKRALIGITATLLGGILIGCSLIVQGQRRRRKAATIS